MYLCEQHNCSSTVSEDLSQDAREKIELSVNYVVRSTMYYSPGTVSEDLCQDAGEEFELSVDTLLNLGGDDWCQGVRPRLQKYF